MSIGVYMQVAEDTRLSEVCSRVVMTGMSSVEDKLQQLVTHLQSMSALVKQQVSLQSVDGTKCA